MTTATTHSIERIVGIVPRCARPSRKFTPLNGGHCPSLARFTVDGRNVCQLHAKPYQACRGACRGHYWPEEAPEVIWQPETQEQFDARTACIKQPAPDSDPFDLIEDAPGYVDTYSSGPRFAIGKAGN